MKVAYLSVHRDATGYAHQAINNMLAIEAGGVDVVARAVKLSESNNDSAAEKVAHLEDKDVANVDVVIQHVLPHMFEYKDGVKNIGVFDWETTHFSRSIWPQCCNMLDEVWVPSIQNHQAAIDSGVDVPIKILPCACDIDRYNKNTQQLDIPQLKDKLVFYTIGEMTRRKNIVATIRAFYSAFTSRDDVVLVIKTTIPGKTPQETSDILKKTSEDIKKSMHIYMKHDYYPSIIGITDFLPDSQLDQLHASCDVFVSASHGEAWGIPVHDAMGFGNPVIVSNWGSFPELTYAQARKYWRPSERVFMMPGQINCGWLINGQLTPCFGQTDSFPDLYTGDEQWFDPCISSLVSCLREAYTEWSNTSINAKKTAAKKRAAEFDYPTVGKIAAKLLGS